MQVQVSGQHISIGSSLQQYVKDKILPTVTKYFAEAPSGHVHFLKRGHEFICDIIINEGTGRHVIIKSSEHNVDIHRAFDGSLGKLEKQLKKYKSKLNDYSKRIKLSEAANEAVKYIISSDINHEIEEFNIDNPAIIAEKPASIRTLTVGEAVMRMDLENLPALMFKNSKTERMNVVYYRKDGHISWVDSK